MSNNNLPPELVEKFDNEINKFQISSDIFRQLHLKNKCVQIAVDYADEQVRIGVSELVHNNQELTGENYILKQQRDELIYLLKESKVQIVKLKDHYHDVGHGLKHLMNIDETLKKYES